MMSTAPDSVEGLRPHCFNDKTFIGYAGLRASEQQYGVEAKLGHESTPKKAFCELDVGALGGMMRRSICPGPARPGRPFID